MKIIVKRFCLSYGGEIYKEGDVVEVADPQMAKRLVARSGGELEIYRGDELEDVEDDDAAPNTDDVKEGDDEMRDVSDSDSDGGESGIPSVDPTAAVQTDDTGANRKGSEKRK